MGGVARQPGFQYMDLDDFEEYLADKPENERWELIGGRVVKMMVGARWEHNYIVQNLSTGIRERLRAQGSPCRTLVETFWLKKKALEGAMLPDIMVPRSAFEPGQTSIEDPVVLVEVLSPGTETRDRIEKWAVYQQISSLRHYVLVARDRPHVEVQSRFDMDWSGFRVIDGLAGLLELPAIGVSVPLTEIYRDVISAPSDTFTTPVLSSPPDQVEHLKL